MPRAKKSPTVSDKLLGAYLAWFESDNGRLVLADLKRNYHDRSAVAIDFDPHRALVAEGCRSVYLGIIAMIREAKLHATGRTGRDSRYAELDVDDTIDAAGAIFERE